MHIISKRQQVSKPSYSLRKLFTSFLGFNAFIFRWLCDFLPGDNASRSFSLLGKENDLEPLSRSLSEERRGIPRGLGVCELQGVFLISLAQSISFLFSFVELLSCFSDDLVFPSSPSESEDMWDLFAQRRFSEDKFSESSSSPPLESVILHWIHRN